MSRPSQHWEGRIGYSLAVAAWLAIWIAFGRGNGSFVFGGVVAVAVIFTVAWRHDRMHRTRGEAPHALWGHNDKNTPWGRAR